jgi:hypothetical protein
MRYRVCSQIAIAIIFGITLAVIVFGGLGVGESYSVTNSICRAGPNQPLITDLKVRQTPDLSEQLPRVSFCDPVFGTCIVRVTARTNDISNEDASTGLKNEYSRVQSFNANETRILVRSTEGTWYLYDAMTLQPIGQIPIEMDPRWDAKDPNILYYIDATRLMSYDIGRGVKSQVHDFAADLPGKSVAAVWTRYEGSPSVDGRYWGLMAEDLDWKTIAFLVYDQANDKIVAIRSISGSPEIDSVTISPLGTYFLAYFDDYCESGLGNDEHPCGLMVYDRNLRNGRGMLRIVGHSDLAIDANGREVLIFGDIDNDNIAMLDLENGNITPLLPIDFSHTAVGMHFSGRAFQQPGWVLVSTYNGGYPADYTWMDDQIFAVELKKGGRVVRLAHHHSLYDQAQEQGLLGRTPCEH